MERAYSEKPGKVLFLYQTNNYIEYHLLFHVYIIYYHISD